MESKNGNGGGNERRVRVETDEQRSNNRKGQTHNSKTRKTETTKH